MAKVNRNINKSKFETNDIPTENDFSDLIDSVFIFENDTTDDIPEGNKKFVSQEEINNWNQSIGTFSNYNLSITPRPEYEVSNTGGFYNSPDEVYLPSEFNEMTIYGSESSLSNGSSVVKIINKNIPTLQSVGATISSTTYSSYKVNIDNLIVGSYYINMKSDVTLTIKQINFK